MEKNRKSKRKKRKKQEDYYIGLPRWLFKSKIISMGEKNFLLVLSDHRNSRDKRCDPGVPLISHEAEICKKTIEKYRKKLAKLGIIGYIPGTDRKNRAKYKLNWLDGSDIEKERLKSIFISSQLGQMTPRLPRLTGVNDTLVTGVNDTPVTSVNDTPHNNNPKRTTKEDNNNTKKSAVSPFSFSGEERKEIATWFVIAPGWEKLSRDTILELIDIAISKGKKDIKEYFRLWKRTIDRRGKDKPAYLISMVKQGIDPPGYQEHRGGRIL